MNFLTADVIWFVSGTAITFSQGGAAKIKSKQFSEFGSRTKNLNHIYFQQNPEHSQILKTLPIEYGLGTHRENKVCSLGHLW